jgi:hypothetical protein
MPFTRTEFVVAILIILAVYGGVCLYSYTQKPLFVNEFGYWGHGLWFLPGWSRERSDLRDSGGARYLADFKTNVFVIVQVPTEKAPPVVPLGSMATKFALLNGESLTLQCSRDTLYSVHLDRTIDSKALPRGRAEQLFQAIEQRILLEQLELIKSER